MTAFQYFRRVNVLVATAFSPCLRRRLAAFAASARDWNSPYRADPDPESQAYLDPVRSSAPFMSRNSGYSGKTTFSKSFSIPVRTRSRSNFPARLPPFAGAPVLGEPLSHADSAQPTSNSLSDATGRVNCVGTAALVRPAERSSAPLFVWGRASPPVPARVWADAFVRPAERSSAPLSRSTIAPQLANARPLVTPTSLSTTTQTTDRN